MPLLTGMHESDAWYCRIKSSLGVFSSYKVLDTHLGTLTNQLQCLQEARWISLHWFAYKESENLQRSNPVLWGKEWKLCPGTIAPKLNVFSRGHATSWTFDLKSSALDPGNEGRFRWCVFQKSHVISSLGLFEVGSIILMSLEILGKSRWHTIYVKCLNYKRTL